MPVLNGSGTIITSSSSNLQSVNLTGASVVANGWNAIVPNSLSAVLDGSPNSPTGWGRVQDNPNRAYIEINLGVLARYYCEIRMGVRMATGWESGEGFWFVEASEYFSGQYLPAWSCRFKPGGTEKMGTIMCWIYTQYLRVGCQDIGAGYPELRVYEVKAWLFSVP